MNNLVSVIIPTIQKKLEILEELVEILSRDVSVSEIIIINNKPELPLLFNNEKVRIHTPETNLYVNKSWNLGVSLAKNNNFCLMNDDLIIGENFCHRIVNSEVFNDFSTGMIGMALHMLISYDEDVVFTDDMPRFSVQPACLNTGDWGAIIFGKKENYYEIPEEYKILYGDNYLLYQNKLAGKINYNIENLPCRHVHSASCSDSVFEKIVVEDILNAKEYFEELSLGEVSSLSSLGFNYDFSGDICKVKITDPSISIFLKCKKNGELLPKEELESKLKVLLQDKISSKLFVDTIISTIYKYG